MSKEQNNLVRLLKLKTGENLISVVEYNKKRPGMLTLHSPTLLACGYQQTEKGTVRYSSLASWIPPEVIDNPVVNIRIPDIIAIVEVSEKMSLTYTKYILDAVDSPNATNIDTGIESSKDDMEAELRENIMLGKNKKNLKKIH